MKINSEDLYKYINELATNQKVKFKVYYDDCYITEILWNGEIFEWTGGTFKSDAFFNPLYDFEVIEEENKKIEKLTNVVFGDDLMNEIGLNRLKINEIIDVVNKLNNKEE